VAKKAPINKPKYPRIDIGLGPKTIFREATPEVKAAFEEAMKSAVRDDIDLQKQILKAKTAASPALDAVRLVYGQRNVDYGDVFQNFYEIAEIANAIKDRSDSNRYTAYNVCMVLRALKLARIRHNPTPDSFSDLCGYTDIQGRMAKEERKGNAVQENS